jgi:hypothetical protein
VRAGSLRGVNEEKKSSFAGKLIAIAVLIVAAWVLLRIVIGIVTGLATLIAAVLAIIAVVWAINRI